jgi:hypothetical protein
MHRLTEAPDQFGRNRYARSQSRRRMHGLRTTKPSSFRGAQDVDCRVNRL